MSTQLMSKAGPGVWPPLPLPRAVSLPRRCLCCLWLSVSCGCSSLVTGHGVTCRSWWTPPQQGGRFLGHPRACGLDSDHRPAEQGWGGAVRGDPGSCAVMERGRPSLETGSCVSFVQWLNLSAPLSMPSKSLPKKSRTTELNQGMWVSQALRAGQPPFTGETRRIRSSSGLNSVQGCELQSGV